MKEIVIIITIHELLLNPLSKWDFMVLLNYGKKRTR
jgi:hypothetical protein